MPTRPHIPFTAVKPCAKLGHRSNIPGTIECPRCIVSIRSSQIYIRSSKHSEEFGRSISEVGYAPIRRHEGRVTTVTMRFAWQLYFHSLWNCSYIFAISYFSDISFTFCNSFSKSFLTSSIAET